MQNSNKLSKSSCIMIAVGGMVGSSIFTLSGVTYSMSGPSALVAWLIAGIILLFYALGLSELSTTFPESGGLFIYPYKIIPGGEMKKKAMGFLAAWSWLNVSLMGAAFSALCITSYIQEYFSFETSSMAYILLPMGWAFICWILNSGGNQVLGRFNKVFTIFLMLICGIYIVFGIGHINAENFHPFVAGSMKLKGMIGSIPIAMLSYGSIVAIASIAGEIKDARKAIPKIMVFSIFITVSMYALILVSIYGMVPFEQFLEDPGRQYYPMQYALQFLGKQNTVLLKLIPLAAILAITTTILVLMMDSSRNIMMLARKEILPKYFSKIDERLQVPKRALGLTFVIILIFLLKPQWIWLMIGTGSICFAITIMVVAITLAIKKSRLYGENQASGYQAPGGIIFPLIIIGIVLFTLVVLYMSPDGKQAFILSGIYYLIGGLIFIGHMLKHKFLKKQ